MTCDAKKIESEIKKLQKKYGVKNSNKFSIPLKNLVTLGKTYSSEVEIRRVENTIVDKKLTPTLDSLPEYTENSKSMTYAGIGSRRGTKAVDSNGKPIYETMTEVAKYLESKGYTLRTGLTFKNKKEGADGAFIDGTKEDGSTRELYRPEDIKKDSDEWNVAKETHGNFEALIKNGDGPARLMARNTNQVFGKDLDNPVDFVLAWTPLNNKDEVVTHYSQVYYGGKNNEHNTGGTGQAIMLASKKGIPVINMADPKWQEQLDAVFKKDKDKPVRDKLERIKTPGNILFDSSNNNILVTHTEKDAVAAHNSGLGVYSKRVFKSNYIKGLDAQHHYGNPFLVTGYEKDKGEQYTKDGYIIKAGNEYEVSKRFANWLLKKSDLDVQPDRRDWIISQILDGKLDVEVVGDNTVPKQIIYYKDTDNLTHAKVLRNLISNKNLLNNKLESSNTNTVTTSSNVYYKTLDSNIASVTKDLVNTNISGNIINSELEAATLLRDTILTLHQDTKEVSNKNIDFLVLTKEILNTVDTKLKDNTSKDDINLLKVLKTVLTGVVKDYDTGNLDLSTVALEVTEDNKYILQNRYEANKEQKHLIDTALTLFNTKPKNISDIFLTVQGMGGTGKSTTIGRAIEILASTQDTVRFVGLAVTHTAKNVLDSMTLTMPNNVDKSTSTLASYLKAPRFTLNEFEKNMLIKNKAWLLKDTKTGLWVDNGRYSVLANIRNTADKTVIVIDEVSMISDDQILQLMSIYNILEKEGLQDKLKIVMLGDYHQLPTVKNANTAQFVSAPLSSALGIPYKSTVTKYSSKIQDILDKTNTIELTEQMRQKEGSDLFKVVSNLAYIVEGDLDNLKSTLPNTRPSKIKYTNTFTGNIDNSQSIQGIEYTGAISNNNNSLVNLPNNIWDTITNIFSKNIEKTKFIAFNTAEVGYFTNQLRLRLFGTEANKKALIPKKDHIILYSSELYPNGAVNQDFTNGKQFKVVKVKDTNKSVGNLGTYAFNNYNVVVNYKSNIDLVEVTLEYKNSEGLPVHTEVIYPKELYNDINKIMSTSSKKLEDVYIEAMSKYVDLSLTGNTNNAKLPSDLTKLSPDRLIYVTKSFVPTGYAYGLTTYKAQGQTIDNVIFYANTRTKDYKTSKGELRVSMNDYTAVSRAKKSLTIIGSADKLSNFGVNFGSPRVDIKVDNTKETTTNSRFIPYNSRVELIKNLYRSNVEKDSNKIYLFGDNEERTSGKNLIDTNDETKGRYPDTTQAVIRGLHNAVGIVTVKNANTKDSTRFYETKDFDKFKKQVDTDLAIVENYIKEGKTVVLPSNGIGTGASNLKAKAPKLYNYLANRLNLLAGNLTYMKVLPYDNNNKIANLQLILNEVFANTQDTELQSKLLEYTNDLLENPSESKLKEIKDYISKVKTNKVINIYSTEANGYDSLSNFNTGTVILDSSTIPVNNVDTDFITKPTEFATVEGAYQYIKAKFFGAHQIAEKILNLNKEGSKWNKSKDTGLKSNYTSGFAAKILGSSIKSKDENLKKAWENQAEAILKKIMLKYYTDNNSAKALLLSTGNKVLTHNGDKIPEYWSKKFPEILTDIRNRLSKTNIEFNKDNSTLLKLIKLAPKDISKTDKNILTTITLVLESGKKLSEDLEVKLLNIFSKYNINIPTTIDGKEVGEKNTYLSTEFGDFPKSLKDVVDELPVTIALLVPSIIKNKEFTTYKDLENYLKNTDENTIKSENVIKVEVPKTKPKSTKSTKSSKNKDLDSIIDTYNKLQPAPKKAIKDILKDLVGTNKITNNDLLQTLLENC